MNDVALVRFRCPGQEGEYLAADLVMAAGDLVVVEADHWERIGRVLALKPAVGDGAKRRILRVATSEDLAAARRNGDREREAFEFCRAQVREQGLPMKLVSVELSVCAKNAIFRFTSNERIDFRALVKVLARHLHVHVDMRQIGVRDAPRYCGGIGVCGRELCCATFLTSFSPISVRMAKDQNLALNQEKLSGVCGRLKCCLAYEEAAYVDLRRGLPKVGKRVSTPEGEGRVKDVNVVKRLVRVQLIGGQHREFLGDEVQRIVPPPPPVRVDEPRAPTSEDAHKEPSRGRRRRRRRRARAAPEGAPIKKPDEQ